MDDDARVFAVAAYVLQRYGGTPEAAWALARELATPTADLEHLFRTVADGAFEDRYDEITGLLRTAR